MNDTANMAARAVQVSIDEDLLRRIDADPETRERGRSAFLRSAAELYLGLKGRRATDSAIHAAFSGAADELLAEVQDFLGAQAWPKK
jgi:metal-responsive CopG/Arc/MetJ family transcriptional regulator